MTGTQNWYTLRATESTEPLYSGLFSAMLSVGGSIPSLGTTFRFQVVPRPPESPNRLHSQWNSSAQLPPGPNVTI